MSEPAFDPATSDDATVSELLTFRTGEQRYAVDILDVREIRGWSVPTPLPHAPCYMRGMVNLRGLVLPVMDLAQRLGLPATRDDPRNVIIVVQHLGRVHGLLVQAVADIVQAPVGAIQDAPRICGEEGVAAERLLLVDDEMIQILSIGRILPPLQTATPEAAA